MTEDDVTYSLTFPDGTPVRAGELQRWLDTLRADKDVSDEEYVMAYSIAKQIRASLNLGWLMTWESARKAVLARDCGHCIQCLSPAVDVHHRRPKGLGGTSDNYVKFGLANLVSLCRECHEWCHNSPGEAYRTGLLLHSWDDPAEVPVVLKMIVVKLTPDGEIIRSGEHALF